MGYYKHYVNAWVTPTRGDGIWYHSLNGTTVEHHGAQQWIFDTTTSSTISLYLVYANYSGTWNINQYVEDTISISVSAVTGGSIYASKSSAQRGETIQLSVIANTGYVFKDFTKTPSSLSIDGNNRFTMPGQNVSIRANFRKISTATLASMDIVGGENAQLTITTESTSYSHKYNLSFGEDMETGEVDVEAGTTSVSIPIPLSWCEEIPNAVSLTGGVLTLDTYVGTTKIGSSEIQGITFNVPASVVPAVGTISTSIARTIDGTTYANIGEIYTQNHCGTRVQATGTGAQGSTVQSMRIVIAGYDGARYNVTQVGPTLDFTTGLLTINGTTTITVTATDSRGRTASQTVTINVEAYAVPTGSLMVRRVNQAGTADDMGLYGVYVLSKQYSQLNNLNTLGWVLSVGGSSISNPADSGDLLPGNRMEFSETQEYQVTLTLTDAFETTIITDTLPSARFILAFDASGNHIGMMKYPNKTIPPALQNDYRRTFEISDDTLVYIGNKTLEEYIQDIINS